MANIKITGYAELAAPISTDVIEVVSDPGGTPISKKVQIRNLFKGGGQIAFPATAVPSADPNTMDDYEKGTAEVTFSAGTGTITIDVARNLLGYVKLSDFVHFQGQLAISAINSPSGEFSLLSLPFASANLAESAGRSGAGASITNLTTAIDGYLAGQIVESSTSVRFRECGLTGAGDDLASHIKTGTDIYVYGDYIA